MIDDARPEPHGAAADPAVSHSLGRAYETRRNSLNFLRLCLAVAVVVSHTVELGFLGVWDRFNETTLGTVAVYGFFGISGYLIAGSAMRNRPLRYLWQRFLRIFPAFWVCLVVTAFGIAVIGWLAIPHACHGASCYLSAPDSPFGYLYRNWLLQINQHSIAGTPRGSTAPLEWNGSLWTLWYEFLCYLMLLGLAAVGVLKQRRVVLSLTAALFGVVTLCTYDRGLRLFFDRHWMATNILRFSLIFLVGSLVYLYRDKIRDSASIALACSVLFVWSLWLPTYGGLPALSFTPSSLFAFLMVYPLLWLGIHLPLSKVGAKNDYSYGVYIYAYPVQQLLAMEGAIRLGFPKYLALSLLFTAPLAVASWWLVERPALALKSMDWAPGRRRILGWFSRQPGTGTQSS